MKKVFAAALFVIALASPAFAGQGDLWLGIGGGLSLPTGDFGDAAKTGFTLGATGSYGVNDQFSLGGDIAWHGWGASSDFERALGPNVDVKFSAIQFTPFAKYHVPMDGKVKPFARGGIGFYSVKSKAEGLGLIGDTSTTDTNFGINLGGGADVMSNDKMAIGINGLYHIIFSDPESSSLITFGVDLKWGFSK